MMGFVLFSSNPLILLIAFNHQMKAENVPGPSSLLGDMKTEMEVDDEEEEDDEDDDMEEVS
jgi:hypothetical protein